MSKVDQAALEAARDAGTPVIGHVSTQADVRALVDGGAAGFVGMITDTKELDSTLLARLRNLRIFFAPALVSQGASLEIAKRNTRRLFSAGVPIALASNVVATRIVSSNSWWRPAFRRSTRSSLPRKIVPPPTDYRK